jgi:hypothetical protein
MQQLQQQECVQTNHSGCIALVGLFLFQLSTQQMHRTMRDFGEFALKCQKHSMLHAL